MTARMSSRNIGGSRVDLFPELAEELASATGYQFQIVAEVDTCFSSDRTMASGSTQMLSQKNSCSHNLPGNTSHSLIRLREHG